MKLLTYLFSVLLIGASCSVSQHTTNTFVPDEAKLALVRPGFEADTRTDRFTIKYVEQVGDFLMIDVSYSGGCEVHEFDLVSNGHHEATYPPELKVLMRHNSKGDKCRSVVDERLYFDLSEYQYPGTSQVRIYFTNNDTTFDFNY